MQPKDNTIRHVIAYPILFVGIVVSIYPVFWMITSAMKTTPELFMSPWSLPSSWRLDHFVTAWIEGRFSHFYANSIKVTVSAVSVMILLAAMAAYGLVRRKARWSKLLLFWFLAGQMIPGQVVIIPLYLQLDALELLNSHAALILVYVASGLPFTVFLLQGFFRGVPNELYDSALIDGCSELQIFRRIALPLVKPGLAAAATFQSLWVWNEFLLALIILNDRSKGTLPLAVYRTVEGWIPRYNLAFSALTIAAVPILIFFALNQRHFISGLTRGAVKG